jgi:hypothetical protein
VAEKKNRILLACVHDAYRRIRGETRPDANSLFSRYPFARYPIPFDCEQYDSRCKAMGADLFFDLTSFADDAFGNATVRNTITALLRADKQAAGD